MLTAIASDSFAFLTESSMAEVLFHCSCRRMCPPNTQLAGCQSQERHPNQPHLVELVQQHRCIWERSKEAPEEDDRSVAAARVAAPHLCGDHHPM